VALAPDVRSARGMNPSPIRLAAALLLVLSSAGCALTPRSMARELGASAPPAAIQSTLHALNDDQNQRLLMQLLTSPETREATRVLAGAIADGTLATLTDSERLERIEAMSTRYMASLTRTVTRTMAEQMRRDIAPAIAEMMRQTVASSMREAMSEAYQRDLERVASGLTRATVEAASRGMAEGIGRDLVPALRTALSEEQTASAIRAATRSLAHEAVLGSNDAMTQLQRQQERGGRPSFLSQVSSLTTGGVKLMQLVAAVAIALVLLLAAWVLRLILRSRRIQAESERYASSAVKFAQAIRAAEGKPWSKELTELLQERLEGAAVAGLLDEVLAPRPTRPSRGNKR